MAKEYCFLIWRELARGEKGMLRFDNEAEREKHVRECLSDFAEAIAEDDQTAEDCLDDLIARLERGETVEDDGDNTQWEYM